MVGVLLTVLQSYMASTVKMDMRELNSALKDYMKVSQKSLAEVVNQKAFFIARGAVRLSDRASSEMIATELGKNGTTVRLVVTGKNAGRFKKTGFTIRNSSLAEKILRARIHAKGGVQPSKADFLATVKRFIMARVKSAAFIAAGWIPSIKYFEARVKSRGGAPPMDRSVKLKASKPLGGAEAAKPGWNVRAILWNSAIARHSKNGDAALSKVGGEALRKSVAAEVKSMREHVAKKLQEDANMHSTRKF